MNNMAFVPELKAFLNDNGTIYTVRRYRYVTREIWVDGVGRCVRDFVRRVETSTDLECYVTESGFANVDNWWLKIRKFIEPGCEMRLFKVTVKKCIR